MVRGIGGRPYVPRGRGGYRGASTGSYRGRSDTRIYDGPRRYDSYDSRSNSRFQTNDRYGSSRSRPDFKRPMTHHYRDDTRDRRISPERKRFRRDYQSSSQGSRNQSYDSPNRGSHGGSTTNNYRRSTSSSTSSNRYDQHRQHSDHNQYNHNNDHRSRHVERGYVNRRDVAQRSTDRFPDPRRTTMRRDDHSARRMAPTRPRGRGIGGRGLGRATGRTVALRQNAQRIIAGARTVRTLQAKPRTTLSNRVHQDLARKRLKLAQIRSSYKRPEAATSSLVEAKKKTDSAAAAKTVKTVAKPVAKAKATLQKKEPQKKVQKTDDDEYLSVTADVEDGAEEEWLNGDGDDAPEADKNEETTATVEADDEDRADDEEQMKKTISVTCGHCRFTGKNFWEYNSHLGTKKHKLAFRRVMAAKKKTLANMRFIQRRVLKLEEVEKNFKPEKRPLFCVTCRLNYRLTKKEHDESQSHKDIKKFLMPYCNICKLAFTSPITYEVHISSLQHLRKRANYNRDHEKSDGEKEVDLENFLTVDEVGDVDLDMAMVEFPEDADAPADSESPKKDSSTDKDKESSTGPRDTQKSKSERINVGSEYIKKVETFYCNLCRIYLDNRDMKEALSRHCGTRSHLQRYVRYRDHKQLVEEAEKLHRSNQEKRAAAKAATAKKASTSESGENAEVVVKKEPNESPKKVVTTTTAANDDDKESDEKMWESVDKDLGDLLREVAPEVADEDEDGEDSRTNTERYDRFKNSEKAGEAAADTTVATGETPKDQRVAKTNGTTEEKAPTAAVEKPAEVTA